MRDVSHLIGIPFKYGGRGPDYLDCYGLVMLLKREDGIILPDAISPDNPKAAAECFAAGMSHWRPCEIRPGAVLGFKVLGAVSHVGYVLDKFSFVHTWEHSGGVCIEPISEWQRRIAGSYDFV